MLPYRVNLKPPQVRNPFGRREAGEQTGKDVQVSEKTLRVEAAKVFRFVGKGRNGAFRAPLGAIWKKIEREWTRRRQSGG